MINLAILDFKKNCGRCWKTVQLYSKSVAAQPCLVWHMCRSWRRINH